MTRDELLKSTSHRELVARYKLCFRTSDENIYLTRRLKGAQDIGYEYTPEEIKAELSLRPPLS